VLAGTAICLLVAGTAVGLGLVGRHGGGPAQGWDNRVWQWAIGHRGPLIGVSKVIATVGDAPALGAICVLLTLALWLTLRSPRALTPFVAYLGGEALVFLIREVVHRGRPLTADYPAPGAVRGVHETSYSFPSGHAVAVTAVVVALLGLLALTRGRWWPWLVALVVAAFVADTRLVLGVHWFSDVAVGLALGASWGAAVAVVARRLR